MSTGYLPPVYQIPKDSEDYLQSFSLNEEEEIKKFFTEYGFVIIRDVLSKEDCKLTIDEMWSILEGYDIKRDDIETWDNRNWRRTGIFSEGILGGDPFFTPQALKNRQNPNLHKAFSLVLGTDKLFVNHDRYGLFRPTKNVPTSQNSSTFVDHKDWKTQPNIHLDMNPWGFIEDKTLDYDNKVLGSLRLL